VLYPLLGTPLDGDQYIIIQRNLAYAQSFAFPNQPFSPLRIEQGMDRIVEMIPQISVLGVGGGVQPTPPPSGNFDQTTAFILGSNPNANINLVTRFKAVANLKDYGAAGNGVTSDLAAWNRMIADLNAGNIRCLYIPAGNYILDGNTTTITTGFSMWGDGVGATTITVTDGTTPVINAPALNGVGVVDRVSISDMSFATTQMFVRRVMHLAWSTSLSASQQRIGIHRIDIQKQFKEGIYLSNIIGGVFSCVAMQGGPYVVGTMDWGWFITATNGNYSVANRWVACSVTTAKKCWVGTQHLEGMYWTQCEAGFSDWGWYMEPTDTTGAPEWHITDCQAEVYTGGIHLKNCAWINISDYSFYLGATAVAGANCIQLVDCGGASIHDNKAIGPGAPGAWNFLAIQGTSSVVSSHHNQIGGLRSGGFGYVLTNTAHDNDLGDGDFFFGPEAGAKPISDSTGQPNRYRDWNTDSAILDFSRKTYAGVSIGGTLVVNNAFQIAAQVGIPSWRGQRFRLQAEVSITNPSTNIITQIRIREYTHRPSGPSPFNVFYVAGVLTSINDMKSLPVGKAARFYIDTVIEIIGSAADALYVLELANDTGTATADVYMFSIQPA
jgi:hypothetical protein